MYEHKYFGKNLIINKKKFVYPYNPILVLYKVEFKGMLTAWACKRNDMLFAIDQPHFKIG